MVTRCFAGVAHGHMDTTHYFITTPHFTTPLWNKVTSASPPGVARGAHVYTLAVGDIFGSWYKGATIAIYQQTCTNIQTKGLHLCTRVATKKNPK